MTKENRDTRLIHAGRTKRYTQGGVNSVIQRASSLIFSTVAEQQVASEQRANQALFYGRRGTLTHFALQEAMTELEHGAGCVLYPCGAAAIANAILAFVNAGDEILVSSGVYEPTRSFCNTILKKLNINTHFFSPTITESISSIIKQNTRVLFLESPASLTMEIENIPAIVRAARASAHNIVIMIDNTWSAGLYFPALNYDIDISIQSGSKYLTGHADTMLGTAVANTRCLAQLRENSYLMGQMIDADSAYMASRGLRTLSTRLRQHEQSALHIATWLSQQPEVARVNHPALPQCTSHIIWQRDFSGSSGLFSFILQKRLNQAELANYLDNFRHFSMAWSWGSFESLITAYQPEEIQLARPENKLDFNGTLIRLHIGLENSDDLIADLKAGFHRLKQK